MPQLHWDALDSFTQDHWRHVAQTAVAFRPTTPGGADDLGIRAGEVLEAILSHADLNGLRDGVAYASLTLPSELLEDTFAVVGALRG